MANRINVNSKQWLQMKITEKIDLHGDTWIWMTSCYIRYSTHCPLQVMLVQISCPWFCPHPALSPFTSFQGQPFRSDTHGLHPLRLKATYCTFIPCLMTPVKDARRQFKSIDKQTLLTFLTTLELWVLGPAWVQIHNYKTHYDSEAFLPGNFLSIKVSGKHNKGHSIQTVMWFHEGFKVPYGCMTQKCSDKKNNRV